MSERIILVKMDVVFLVTNKMKMTLEMGSAYALTANADNAIGIE